MKHSATSSELAVKPRSCAAWPLPEPTLAYFPDARFVSDRDLDAPVAAAQGPGGVVVDAPDHGHVPVLLERCVQLLAPALTRRAADGSGAVLLDGTLGAGGHAERFLTEFPGLRLIGLDRDREALAIAGRRLERFGDRVQLVRTRYDGIAAALDESGLAAAASVDGLLFDLGVSSMQLDRPERGFSYGQDAPLDMRMDSEATLTAEQILNTYDRKALTDILRRFGEEKFASRVAGFIVERRAKTPLTRTSELVEIIYDAIPAPARRTGGHPAKRTFQALRIAVNAELEDWGPLEEATGHSMATHGVELWAQGTASAGIWQCEPGPSHWVLDINEVIYLVAGRMTVTPDGGESKEIGVGDIAVFPLGWSGTWEIHETVRKIYSMF